VADNNSSWDLPYDNNLKEDNSRNTINKSFSTSISNKPKNKNQRLKLLYDKERERNNSSNLSMLSGSIFKNKYSK
jgi:hypothetical protein